MKGAWLGAVAVAIACSAMQCQSTKQRSNESPPTETVQHPTPHLVSRPAESSTVMLTQQLEHCEDQLETVEKTDHTRTTTKTTPHVKVVNGPPKKCADPAPTIKPVDTTNCQAGMVCLDEKAQATLARNLAAYEAWMTRVTSCENAP
jgi:hypothetical protein